MSNSACYCCYPAPPYVVPLLQRRAVERSCGYDPPTTTSCTLPPWPSYAPWGSDSGGTTKNEVYNGDGFGYGSYQRKCQWRITHQPTPTCYLKVWLRKLITTRADGYATPVYTHEDLPSYVWEGVENPCFIDPTKNYLDSANTIIGPTNEVMPPSTNWTSESVVVLKYSYFPDYEPDITDEDNPQPNGFPDPEWEVAAP